MGTMLAYILLIAAILPLSALLSPPENDGSTGHHGAVLVVLALGALFFTLGSVHPAGAPGAWAFRAFYGILGLVAVIGANVLACVEWSHV